MVVTLFSVGGIMALAGLLGVGYGLAIEGLSFGGTAILGGSIGLAGGLVVFGLGATIRELRRLGRQLERAAPRLRPADTDGALRGPGRGVPARQQPMAPRRPADLRPAGPPLDRSPEAERQHPGGFPGLREVEPPVVDEADLVPLSPAGVGRAPPRLPTGAQDEGSLEPRFEPPAPTPRPPPRFESPRVEPERPKRNLFDTTWQSPGSATVRAQGERRTPDQEPAAEPPHAEEPMVSQPDEPAPAVPEDEPQPAPVSILKSGVIDGMAYTLYTDGSIEAQLPNGIMRFASIDELRSHLEKNG